MKPKNYIYIGEPLPKITVHENKDFIMNFQKAMLLSLVKRGLLTQEQTERITDELEKKYETSKKFPRLKS